MSSIINKLIKLPLSVLILISLCMATCLYWSSLNGAPIFDDHHFIFQDDVIIGNFSYLTIWTEFAWPLSISVHKFIFSIWKDEFLYYHLLNLILHFLNSYLLLKLALKLRLPYPKLLFILFLVHPSNVIAVSWMVQLKTLLCFTFSILSLLCLLKAFENKKWYLPSWISFYLSIISKSASVPLSFFFLYLIFKKSGPKSLIWALPFVLMSSFSAYTILSSSLTSTATAQLESSTFVDAKVEESKKPVIVNSKIKNEDDEINKLKNRLILVLKTSHYYFWQVILPLENYPIKGQAPKGLGVIEVFHFIFIVILCILNSGNLAALYIFTGYLLILPFLGLVSAPFMNLTWVSEQHLYLALPFFLCFWLALLSKWKLRFAHFLPLLFVIFFSIQTFRAAGYYKDEIIFYSKSLLADPYNIPVAQNLAVSYLDNNEPLKALAVTSKIIEISRTKAEIRESKYFHYFLTLHEDIVKQLLDEP
jgi:hypothetical protein